ncbi:hypothetical protein CAMRE0001_3154 [Campylobacter rectus RM3267]|uniref:Uncharacterized protein n=1 Tax=Campylobacter rectus RM3267 TaxID=553218 RepID=B9D169_CAMRE|nr:hypothetical protein CAMRE0001_3154 [Campylobacter rectus RM3267]
MIWLGNFFCSLEHEMSLSKIERNFTHIYTSQFKDLTAIIE